jgi:hypothetical protein
MKKTFFFFALLLPVFVFAQKVGIGTNTPLEKLDVNGNINMSGNLKINNVAGQPNQVLMTNNTGNTVWADLGNYKNVASFTVSGTWMVPPGVTKVRIEAWGGGGGGGGYGGGAGGTYIVTQELTVIPGNNITLTIGPGGAPAVAEGGNAAAGGNTVVNGSFGIITAAGGGGAYNFSAGEPNTFALTGDSYIQLSGQPGFQTVYDYAQRTTSQIVEIRKYGNGGGVAPFYNNGGHGGSHVIDQITTATIKLIVPSYIPINYGAGGGGGYTGGVNWGASGGQGMIIIYY